MSAFYIYADEPRLNKTALETALSNCVQSDIPLAVEAVFVSEDEIRTLNKTTRNIDKVTDVLSYPAMEGIRGKKLCKKQHPLEIDDEGNLLIGSIAVCIQRAKEQAEEYGHSFERELHYLIVHGVMHCLGYDHITDADKAQMREQEERVLQKIGITRE